MNFSKGFGGKRGVKNGNSKNISLEKFWPSLEISEMFLMGLEVLFSSDFYVLESQICCPFSFGLPSTVEIFQNSWVQLIKLR